MYIYIPQHDCWGGVWRDSVECISKTTFYIKMYIININVNYVYSHDANILYYNKYLHKCIN